MEYKIEFARKTVKNEITELQAKSIRDRNVEKLWCSKNDDILDIFVDDTQEWDWDGNQLLLKVDKIEENVNGFSVFFYFLPCYSFPRMKGVIMVSREDEWSGPGGGPWCKPLLYMTDMEQTLNEGQRQHLLGKVEAVLSVDDMDEHLEEFMPFCEW
jgi:hypothetical protein